MAELFTPATKLTTIDVKRKAGATLGAKLQAAHDALPATGGVLDCRRMTGAQQITATVTISKVCQILFGASVITNSAAIGINLTATSIGSRIDGAGEDVSVFTGTGGRTHIKLTGSSRTTVRGIGCTWTTDNAANIGIYAEWNGVTAIQRVVIECCKVIGGGAGTLGDGIKLGTVYSSTVINNYLENLTNGVNLAGVGALAANAIMICNNRIHDTLKGISIVGTGDVFIYGNTIEGAVANGKSVYAEETESITSAGNHFEQTGAGTPIDVHVIAPTVSPFNTRNHTFVGDTFSGSAIPLRTTCNSSTTFTIVGGGNGSNQFESTGGAPFIFSGMVPLGTTSGTYTRYGNALIRGDSSQTLTIDTWDHTLITRTMTETGVGVNVTTLLVDLDANATANSASQGRAIVAEAFTHNGTIRNYTNALVGVFGVAIHQGTGASTLSTARGVYGEIQLGTAGIISSGQALTARIFNSGAGTITEGIGLYIQTPVNSGGGAITTYYGIAIADVGTVAGTSYALNTAGGSSLFTLSTARSETFKVNSTTESNFVTFSGASNNAGIGVAPDAATRLFCFLSPTTINTEFDTIVAQMQYNPAAASTGAGIGIASNTFTPSGNGNNPGKIVGVASVADHRGSGSLTNGWAIDSNAVNRNAGTITNLVGLHIEVDNLNAAGTVGTGYGILIEPVFNAGTMGTYAGIWVLTPTAASDNYALITQGGKVIFNNGSLDADLRMKGDNNDPVFFMDASADSAGFGTTTPSAQVHISSFVVATGNPVLFRVTEAGHTNITATAEKLSVDFALDQTIQHATGNIGTQRAFVIRPPTYSFVGASNITTAATVAITGAPVAGTNATIVGNTLALWIQSGQSLFQGGLLAERTIGTCTALGAGPIGLAANVVREVFSNEGATAIWELDLPSAVAGLEYEFVVQDADGVRVVAAGGDTIRLAGSVSAAAGKIESTTIGSTVKLVAINATEWVGIAINGSWTVT